MEEERVATWERVMARSETPTRPQCADEGRRYLCALTSTKRAVQATYYRTVPVDDDGCEHSPFTTVLELLMLGADPALRLTATKRGHLGPGRCQITAVFQLMNEGNYTRTGTGIYT